MKKVFYIIPLLAFISIGEALECHQCSLENPKCNDPLDENADGVKVVTCPDTNVCYKASGTASVSGFQVSGTQRDCILDTMVPPCMMIKLALQGQNVNNIECYSCSKDRCNKYAKGTASGLTSLKITLLLPILTGFLWRKI